MMMLLLSLAFSAEAITVNEYAIPTPNSNPFQIVAGPDGNLWFTESRESKIGRITPSGLVTEYPLLDPLSGAQWITAGPDGNVWFIVTFPGNYRIARITPNGAISEFALPSPNPYSLISGQDALWYLIAGQKIGKVTTSGMVSEFTLPVPFGNTITEITTDAEGNLRFVQLRSQPPPAAAEYFLGKLTPNGTFWETPLGQFGLYYITDLGLGPDGNLWISTFGTPDDSGLSREVYNGFRRLNPDGTLSATFIPTQSLAPTKFIIGPDAGFWFLANHGPVTNRLGKVTLSSAVVQYETGGVTLFTDFVGGPDGNLWLIDPSRNLVGKLTPDGPNSIVTARATSYVSGALAAESIAALFGNSLAPARASASELPLPTTLAGVSVKVRDSSGVERAAPLFFVSPSQINLLIPAGTSSGNATVTVVGSNGQTINTGTLIVDQVAPGLFTAEATGSGPAAGVVLRVKADGSQSYEPIARFDPAQNKYVTVPIDLGPESDQVFLVLFGSGLRGNSDLGKVSAFCSGGVLPVVYAGAQGGYAGLDQINLRLPRTLTARGEQNVTLTVAGRMANRVRINLRAG
jgi:uncharacterized protein (TIGR03437 family)